ncbi:MAG TPA: hypothetical protein VGF55_30240 [Gemmataceae bacterium]
MLPTLLNFLALTVAQRGPADGHFTIKVIDAQTGRGVPLVELRTVHGVTRFTDSSGGSVYWNKHRRRWVVIAVGTGGTSFLGEVWYAEAQTPTGPWGDAVRVVSDDRYGFYNAKQHPGFAKDNGRVIYFEGTYSHTFSGNPNPTPRYDYNQIMCRLDLSDPRVVPPRGR